ncbi:hypothetical protein ACVOMV_25775 [Mesorhizobium atlanticum]
MLSAASRLLKILPQQDELKALIEGARLYAPSRQAESERLSSWPSFEEPSSTGGRRGCMDSRRTTDRTTILN